MDLDPALKSVHDSIQSTAAIFLRRSVTEMHDHSSADQQMTAEAATVCCTLLQLSLELFAQAAVLRRDGLLAIAHPKHSKDSVNALLVRFESNDFRAKEFEKLKQFMQAESDKYQFDRDDWRMIGDFQRLRNKLVHIGYSFRPNELVALRTSTIWVITHTLAKLITDDRVENPSEVLEPYLGAGVFQKLISYPPYIERMSSLVRERDGRTLTCWQCREPTFSQDAMTCYCCSRNYDMAIDFVDCLLCGSKECVVYDTLNIDRFINGLCLICDEHSGVLNCPHCYLISVVKQSYVSDFQRFVCPKCKTAFEVEGPIGVPGPGEG